MSKFMCIKFENPKTKQSEIANQLGYSMSSIQRFRNDINMLSLYRIQTNNTNKRTKKPSNTIFDNNSHREHDLKKPQSISESAPEVKSVKSKNKLKVGGNVKIKDEHLYEILHNNNS